SGIASAWLAHQPKVLPLILAYAIMNVVYCLGAKRVTMLDVFIISAGFVMRVLLGCFLLNVPPSNWLLLCSSALALFLSFATRRAAWAAGLRHEHRPSLAGYRLDFLNQMLGITATITVMSYCLYSRESPVFLESRKLASVPFVAYGIFHYLRCVQKYGSGAS